mmetsp:Transcript_24795/g.40235  ORF Transcript_24795/g.40235 Transcript_24795/m.40235 type:complete len:104 (-) Transcript_24795:763-1074(-)
MRGGYQPSSYTRAWLSCWGAGQVQRKEQPFSNNSTLATASLTTLGSSLRVPLRALAIKQVNDGSCQNICADRGMWAEWMPRYLDLRAVHGRLHCSSTRGSVFD